VVVVMEVVLPVVAEAERESEAWAHRDFILHEDAEHLLEKRHMSITPLLDERVGRATRILRQVGEVERAADVRPIVEVAPAPVGDVDPALDRLPAAAPGEGIRQRAVVLGAQEVRLRAAAREGILYDDARGG